MKTRFSDKLIILKYTTSLRLSFALAFWISCVTFSSCFGQSTTKIEDSFPLAFRNREDVKAIVQKLNFLRINRENFGENHLKWKSLRAQIQEHETTLQSMFELGHNTAPVKPSSVKIEDSLPLEFRKREDVQSILQKLKFLRMRSENFGEKHPARNSIQSQIQVHETALQSMLELGGKTASPRSNSVKIEDSLPLEFRNRDEVQSILQKLKFLRMSSEYFGEKHPARNSIQSQIQEHETALHSMLELDTKTASPKSSPNKSNKIEGSLTKEFLDRDDVQSILQKLSFLRINEANYGENHPRRKEVRAAIQEHESALRAILELDPGSSKSSSASPDLSSKQNPTNPFRSSIGAFPGGGLLWGIDRDREVISATELTIPQQ